MPSQLSVDIPRTPRAPAIARHKLLDLRDGIEPDVMPDLRLLVSELISNSVKYGGDGAVRLDVRVADDVVRAEIVDHGSGFVPRVRDRPLDEVGGWGLHLVEHLADRWGTHEGSTHVWFEIRPSAE